MFDNCVLGLEYQNKQTKGQVTNVYIEIVLKLLSIHTFSFVHLNLKIGILWLISIFLNIFFLAYSYMYSIFFYNFQCIDISFVSSMDIYKGKAFFYFRKHCFIIIDNNNLHL